MNQRGTAIWQKVLGGRAPDRIYALDATSDGGWILAGSTASFGKGGTDAWLVKITAEGELQWQRTYGRRGDDAAHAVRQTADGGYIVTADIRFTLVPYYVRDKWWIIKTDAAGNTDCKDWFGCFTVQDSTAEIRNASFPVNDIKQE